MTNGAAPDQLASKPTDLDLHCLLKQDMSRSAREELNLIDLTSIEIKAKVYLGCIY